MKKLGFNIIDLRSESLPVDCFSGKGEYGDLILRARSFTFADNTCQWDLFFDFTVLSPWGISFVWDWDYSAYDEISGYKSELPLFSGALENGSEFDARLSLTVGPHGGGSTNFVEGTLQSVTVSGPVPWSALHTWGNESWIDVALPGTY